MRSYRRRRRHHGVNGAKGTTEVRHREATVAIQNRKLVFTADEDFPRMAAHVPVRLFIP